LKITITLLTLLLLCSHLSIASDYTGNFKVFMVEPTSRWSDQYGMDYGYGFLDFGLEQDFEVKEYGAWEYTQPWSANAAGFEGVTEGNLAAIGVVFDDSSVTQDAFPPWGYWFNAHFVDASLIAYPGMPASISPGGGYTHTVFIEQGATTG